MIFKRLADCLVLATGLAAQDAPKEPPPDAIPAPQSLQ
jgi:hypothetical protein